MAEKVILHVGAMKSGTSYIQQRLLANPAPLAAQGVLFPGRSWRHQVLGVRDVLEQTRDGGKSLEAVGAWQRLLDEMAEWPGTAVISMESLGPTRPELIAKVVDSLAPAEVHAVMTVRDLARSIPAMWQEGLQNFHTWTWQEFVDGVAKGDRSEQGPARTFWRQQDTPSIARRWAAAVPQGNFTLITLPPAGADPGILWTRFCSVIGIDPDSCGPGRRSNESLGAESAMVMRELNVRLAERGMERRDYIRLVKHLFAKKGLVTRKPQEPSIGFDQRWVTRRSKRMIKQFEKLPVRVLGDLQELVPAPVPGVNPTEIDVRAQLDAAVDGLAEALTLWADERNRRARNRKSNAAAKASK